MATFSVSNKLFLFLLLTSFFIYIHAIDAALSKSEMIKQMLDGHNKARNDVGVPPLKWDPLLARYARYYADQRRKDCRLVHSPGYGFGECLFWGKGTKWSPKDAVAAWVAEKNLYNYNSNSCYGKKCSHYTQIVWSTTRRVGCAKIICNGGDSFIACEYHPPGNYIGERPY